MLGRVCEVLGFTKTEFVDNMKHRDSGTTVPTDGAAGYAKGCLFVKTDGGANTTWYCNEGSATSCDFNAK